MKCPLVMGILNVTPDSFSDGGRFNTLDTALSRARQMAAEGVDIVDIGGESTRPGAATVSVQEELDRVIPVIEALHHALPVVISVDTSQPAVMRAAVDAGAGFINDVRALQIPGALEAAAQLKVPVCLMHMQGEPAAMQIAPHYQNVISEVIDFLSKRIQVCLGAGISPRHINVDPGIGFGKTLLHNLALIKNLPKLCELGYPVMIGASRKRMIGEILDVPVEKRLVGSLTLAILAAQAGASLLRVHDVKETVEAMKILSAVKMP